MVLYIVDRITIFGLSVCY